MRRLEERAPLFESLRQRYGSERLLLLHLDINQPEDRSAAVQQVAKHFGSLNCLVNNAGMGIFGAFEGLREEALRQQFDVCFFGAAAMTRDFLPLLRHSKGRVVFVSSILGLTSLPFSSAYCASKFALEGLAESLYYELRPFGVEVALIEPGGFRTDFRTNMSVDAKVISGYERVVANFFRYRDRNASARLANPARVAECLVNLAEKKHLPLRTVIGIDAHLTAFARRMLPERLFFPLVRWGLNRIMTRS